VYVVWFDFKKRNSISDPIRAIFTKVYPNTSNNYVLCGFFHRFTFYFRPVWIIPMLNMISSHRGSLLKTNKKKKLKIRDDLPLTPQFTHGPAIEYRNLR